MDIKLPLHKEEKSKNGEKSDGSRINIGYFALCLVATFHRRDTGKVRFPGAFFFTLPRRSVRQNNGGEPYPVFCTVNWGILIKGTWVEKSS